MIFVLRAARRCIGLHLRLGAAAVLAVTLYSILLFVFALEAVATGKGAK